MKLNDRLIGGLAIIGGGLVFFGTLGFRDVPGQQFGSDFFPRIVSCFLILIGGVQIYCAKSSPLIVLPDWLNRVAAFKVAFLLFVVVGWIVSAPIVGFFISTFFLILTLTLVAGGKATTSLMVSTFATILLYLVFGTLLRVPLPFGYIEGMLI